MPLLRQKTELFIKNPGFSVKGMARAAISSVIHHGIVGGGSTLTQQLAKNALLTQKQTFLES